jgi:paired amphipathic helix protein Sin3a
LIQGFNTFLPVGYRIEISSDSQDATNSYITVTTPSGTTIQSTNEALPDRPEVGWGEPVVEPPQPPQESPVPLLSSGKQGGTYDLTLFCLQLTVFVAPLLEASDPRMLPAIDGEAIQPAMQYVQKIKQRCDPEVYRQFLEILSQYHSDPDTIDEVSCRGFKLSLLHTNHIKQEEVSRQIARLFKDAPDLRSDFRIFMPAHSQSLDDPSNMGDASRGKRKLEVVAAATLPNKRKRKGPEKEPVTITKQPASKVWFDP